MTNTLQNTTALTPQALARETSLSYDLNKMIVGYECEVGSQRGNYISPSIIRDKLLEQGLNYVIVTTDGSANVDAEIIFPPLIINEISIETYIKPVLNVLERCNCVIRKNCGGHIHVGTRLALNSPSEFNNNQIAHFKNHLSSDLSSFNSGAYISPNNQLTKMLPFEMIKDVIRSYAINQNYISSTLPESRRFHAWSYPINSILNSNSFINATRVEQFTESDLGKQRAINTKPFTSKFTIEFRQGASTLSGLKLLNWVKFIKWIYVQSMQRCDWTTLVVPVQTETRTIEVETPQQHNNGRSFVARVYDMCRNHNNGQGATIEEIMNVTGATDQNIRSRVSELRRAYGQGAIITHTQQANNHVYGDGQIYCRYQILHRFEKVETVNSNSEEMPTVQLLDNLEYDVLNGMSHELREWNEHLIETRS